MTEVYRVYDSIPLIVRKPSDKGYPSKEKMEQILRSVFEQTLIAPHFEITTYKGTLKAVKYSESDNVSYLLHEDIENDGENNVSLDFSFVESEDEKPNIVKRTCKELGITQKELAELMGVNDGTVRKWSSQAEPPEWAIKFTDTLLKNKDQTERLNMFKSAFDLIDKARGL